MRRRIELLWLIGWLVLAFGAVACGSKEGKALEQYAAKLEAAKVHADSYRAARAKVQQYLGGETQRERPPLELVKQEMLPAQRAYVDALEAIGSGDAELERLHRDLLRAERRRLNGVFEMEAALLPSDEEGTFRQKIAMLVRTETEADEVLAQYDAALAARCEKLRVTCPKM